MGKLTKASFAAAKRRLGIKKVTKKNIGRIARAARKGTGRKKSRASPKRKTSSKRRKSNPRKGGNRKMGRRGLSSRKVFSIAKQLALGAAAIDAALRPGSMQEKVIWIVRDYTGWNLQTNTFDAGNLVRGYGPYIAVSLAQKVTTLVNRLLG